jgi:hypothetical protein
MSEKKQRKQRQFKKNKLNVVGHGFIPTNAFNPNATMQFNPLPPINQQHESESDADEATIKQIPLQFTLRTRDSALPNKSQNASVWNYVFLQEEHTVTLPHQCVVSIINDFDLDETEGLDNVSHAGLYQNRKGYAVVFLLKLETEVGGHAVSCCSLCASGLMLPFYAIKSHQHSTFNVTHLFSCRHASAVVQHQLANAQMPFAVRDDERCAKDLASTIPSYHDPLQPGWIRVKDISHIKGVLVIYVTTQYAFYVFAVRKRPSGLPKCFCFHCNKDDCHHSSEITHSIWDGVPEDTQLKLRLPATTKENLVSVKRYPCIVQY